jgi:hypothetical protein
MALADPGGPGGEVPLERPCPLAAVARLERRPCLMQPSHGFRRLQASGGLLLALDSVARRVNRARAGGLDSLAVRALDLRPVHPAADALSATATEPPSAARTLLSRLIERVRRRPAAAAALPPVVAEMQKELS